MKKHLTILLRIVLIFFLFAVGFAAGLPIGQRMGFATGTEWALVQAAIVAREAGVAMPVTFESGNFHVTLQQPRNIYKLSWKLADRHEEALQGDVEDQK